MRIAVTGREGQVVRALIEQSSSGHQIVPVGRPDLDLASPREAIVAALEQAAPDLIVSSAAYTAVDKAESESELAFAVNQQGAESVAGAAQRLGVPLIHLSTDYVFDGRKPVPYTEEDSTGPTGVYGASKLAGEQAALGAHNDVAVLRTAWVYSPFGSNFVRTMLRFAGERDEMRVVADQLGNPTSALEIAKGVLRVAENLRGSSDAELRGVFHMTASGEASWAEFAEAIFTFSAERGGPSARVTPIGTANYPTPASRPANSRLNCDKLARAHAVRLAPWRPALAEVIARLVSTNPMQEVAR